MINVWLYLSILLAVGLALSWRSGLKLKKVINKKVTQIDALMGENILLRQQKNKLADKLQDVYETAKPRP